ncbi:hypothetical protein EC991_003865 [Linnemannia zychae]|nr:hypothetical protein EC991_003865 [Linnemannia zychae]
MYQPKTTRPPPPPPPLRRLNSLQIEISGIPAENGKCRVETQLKIALHIKNAQNENVKDWKQLRLPHALIAKEKHRMEKFNGRSKHIEDSEILTLDARLVCDHDMTKILECCDNCIGRERKRAHRRKESQKLPGPLSSIPIFGSINPKNGPLSLANEPIPPTPTDPIEYQAWERHRIMVFSSTEYVDISSGQCLLPTRITCYCRHHNEKVGFRIQFTAKDSTGAVVASVLSNAVMMMDDHKSGKRPTAGTAKSASSTAAARKKAATTALPNGLSGAGSTGNQDDGDQEMQNDDDDDDDQEDMDQGDTAQGEAEEIDLEAGHHMPPHGFAPIDMKFEDAEIASGDVLAPLTSAAERLGAKRRVDENAMDGVQTQSVVDPSRGPFRRKTSHDIPQGISAPASFASVSHSFSTDSISSPSPFMPGSPFANDSQHNAFSPSFSQALDGSFLDQKNIDMFLASGLPPSVTQQNGFHKYVKDTTESEESMMEFTTLDEAMGSPPDAFHASTISTNTTLTSQAPEQVLQPTTSQSMPTRASFSIPAPSFTSGPTSTSKPSSANAFSTAGMLNSAFSTTFSAPMNGPATSSSLVNAPGMSSSFLNPSQMQEFQSFQRQNSTQQKQQQLLLQLQQGVQNQNKQQMEPKTVPWTMNANKADTKDPYWKMRMAMSQTTNPSSSAFIPIPTSLPEDGDKVATPKPSTDANATSTSSSSTDTPLAPKKRGRPRKAAPTASEASSPVLSPLPPTPIQSSPSPSLASLAPPSATAASAAAQFLLFQQRQQQQLQHHQQQLQQQQKQAILARQKPRVQKLIPSRGPVEGGVEITLLGSGFFPGMVPTFDGVPAQDVQYYGPETVICRLPPRSFPGSVVVKAQTQLSAAAATAGPGTSTTDDANSNELVRTMTQLFGGPLAAQQVLGDDDVGVLFEYEESKGDRDLIALALQVLGMKMNGRVEPPHQVAMRIMGTAAASNAIMGQDSNTLTQGSAGSSSSASQQSMQLQQFQLQQQHQQQQQQQQQQHQRALLGFGQQLNGLQANGLGQSQPPQQQAQNAFLPQTSQGTGMTNGAALGAGMMGFGSFLNSNLGGANGGGI